MEKKSTEIVVLQFRFKHQTYSRGIYVLECVSVLSNHKLIHHPMYTHRLQLLSIHKTELNMNLLLYGIAYGIQWLITTIIIIIKYWFVFGCFFRTITDDISDRCHHNHPFDMKRMFFFCHFCLIYFIFTWICHLFLNTLTSI